MRAVVTGGAGFIGHHLVAALTQRGDLVTILDDLSAGTAPHNLHGDRRVVLIEADVRDGAALDRAFTGAQVVFHLAALTSVARSVVDPHTTHKVNAGGTSAVLHAAARAGVGAMVLASSAAVYGERPGGADPGRPQLETDPLAPASPYAASKAEAEAIVARQADDLGVRAVVLRYFNVYGTGQNPDAEYAAVLPSFIAAALRGEPAVIHGDGTQRRDFVHVSDVVAANLLAADLLAAGADRRGERLIFNIGSGTGRSVIELHSAVAHATGAYIPPTFAAARPGDVRTSSADIARAASQLGFRVKLSFAEGVRQTVDGYRAAWRSDGSAERPGSAPAAAQAEHLTRRYREAS
jgi:UDP-glucose 4-epimerase